MVIIRKLNTLITELDLQMVLKTYEKEEIEYGSKTPIKSFLLEIVKRPQSIPLTIGGNR